MWRYNPDVKDDEKEKHRWKPSDICGLIYKNKRYDFIIKTLKFLIFDVGFLILLSVYLSETL